MPKIVAGACLNVKGMSTERITLELESKALYAARVAAEAQQMSLSEWVSKTAWEQAIAEEAVRSAENERRFPDEPPGWNEAVEAHGLGEGDK